MNVNTCYVGSSGKIYKIGNTIGQPGGEGQCYRILNNTTAVLKIYHASHATKTQERKLKTMINCGKISNSIAWPQDLVYDNGRFIGYVMPLVSGCVELQTLYSAETQANHNTTLKDKCFIARNICAVMDDIHFARQVCGDLNPKNILINPKSGLATFVDADSYNIRDNKTGYVFECNAALQEYLPAEWSKGAFTVETDLFGLAKHVFHLLMNGYDPHGYALEEAYKRRPSVSASAISVPTNIKKGVFPYANPQPGTRQPEWAPNYKYLPKEIRELFERAFIQGHYNPRFRPTAREWVSVIGSALGQLTVCSKNSTHYYFANTGYGNCPWCELVNGAINQHINASTTNNISANLSNNVSIENSRCKAPPLITVNGCGVKLYGISKGKGNPYSATLFFVILFIPIIPLARYLVTYVEGEDGSGYFFHKKLPYGQFNIIYLFVSVIIILILFNL